MAGQSDITTSRHLRAGVKVCFSGFKMCLSKTAKVSRSWVKIEAKVYHTATLHYSQAHRSGAGLSIACLSPLVISNSEMYHRRERQGELLRTGRSKLPKASSDRYSCSMYHNIFHRNKSAVVAGPILDPRALKTDGTTVLCSSCMAPKISIRLTLSIAQTQG